MFDRNTVSTHFGKTAETIRRWSQDFSQFLSVSANDSNKSEYTDDDMEVLVYVNDAYKAKKSTETIILELGAGNRGEWNGVLEPKSLTVTGSQVIELSNIMAERDDLRNQLTEANQRIAVLMSQVSDVDKLREEVKSLNREIGRLEARLEILRDGE